MSQGSRSLIHTEQKDGREAVDQDEVAWAGHDSRSRDCREFSARPAIALQPGRGPHPTSPRTCLSGPAQSRHQHHSTAAPPRHTLNIHHTIHDMTRPTTRHALTNAMCSRTEKRHWTREEASRKSSPTRRLSSCWPRCPIRRPMKRPSVSSASPRPSSTPSASIGSSARPTPTCPP
jgi:hypothetical protein